MGVEMVTDLCFFPTGQSPALTLSTAEISNGFKLFKTIGVGQALGAAAVSKGGTCVPAWLAEAFEKKLLRGGVSAAQSCHRPATFTTSDGSDAFKSARAISANSTFDPSANDSNPIFV